MIGAEVFSPSDFVLSRPVEACRRGGCARALYGSITLEFCACMHSRAIECLTRYGRDDDGDSFSRRDGKKSRKDKRSSRRKRGGRDGDDGDSPTKANGGRGLHGAGDGLLSPSALGQGGRGNESERYKSDPFYLSSGVGGGSGAKPLLLEDGSAGAGEPEMSTALALIRGGSEGENSAAYDQRGGRSKRGGKRSHRKDKDKRDVASYEVDTMEVRFEAIEVLSALRVRVDIPRGSRDETSGSPPPPFPSRHHGTRLLCS